MTNSKLQSRIRELKKIRGAIILAHNYQVPEIYDVADFVGDSYELARQAQKTDSKTIVFCGVHFMAESAKILNPDKCVLIPDRLAGCPLADMVTAAALREQKRQHPDAAVVAYVNSTAEVKAESDVCVTSANAVKIVKKLDAQKILFVPDRNLGSYVAEQVPRKEIIPWPGHCYVHAQVRPQILREAKSKHPEALVVAHPECPADVRALADHICGTGGMIRYVRESEANEFIIATEPGMLERLKREAPNKKFYCVCTECINMKKITLEKVLHALEHNEHEVDLPKELINRAKKPLDRMMGIG